MTSDDLETMYERYPNGGQITLWCEGRAGVIQKTVKSANEIQQK